MSLKIGIDARLFDEAGNGRYIRNLLLCLQKIDSQNFYSIFLLKKDFDKVTFNKNFTKVIADIKWYGLKEQIEFPKVLSKYNLDLVHFPHFNVPILFTGNFIVTIHDLIHQHFQMRKGSTLDPITYKVKQLGYKQVFKNAVNKSLKIIVPSNFVKESLMKEWKVKKEKITVTYEAVDGKMFSAANILKQKKVKEVMEKYNITSPFIFYVGNAHPHKNIEGLIEAFLKLKMGYLNLSLVLAGKDHYFWQRMKARYSYVNIKYVGFITDEELVAFYKEAICYVLPSFEEGFGIPLLEAFALNCPVAASDIGALREIGEDAALFFNPNDINNMAQTIRRLLDSDKLRKLLAKKGKKRFKEFSWERLARQTKEVYESSIST